MPRYFASVRHNSIARFPEIAVGFELEEAKQLAEERLGDGFHGHEIVVYTDEPDMEHMRDHTVVATKVIGEGDWKTPD